MIAVTQLQDQRTSVISVHAQGTLLGTVVVWSIATSVMGKGILLKTVTQVLVSQIATTVRSQDILPGTVLKSLVFVTLVKSPAISARSVPKVMLQRTLMLSVSSVTSLATWPETAQKAKERKGNVMCVARMVTWPATAMTKKIQMNLMRTKFLFRKCYVCGQNGHLARKCSEKANSGDSDEKDKYMDY